MDKIIECVPNFSEGRDLEKVEKIVDNFRGVEGVKLLDYSTDKDHNRLVVTAVGEPEPLGEAMVAAAKTAFALIDMTKHQGQHPRMGAVDVVPFIPIKNATFKDADTIAKKVAQRIGEECSQPVFLYERSASAPHRANLADIRKGQYEAMEEKLKDPKWIPDFGPREFSPKGGVTAVGARMPLVAFNVNLNTSSMDVANHIVRQVRYINGGFRYCKAMAVMLEDRNIVQVSMNLTDYTKTAIYTVFETVKMEARRFGVEVVGTELIGTVPMQALVDSVSYYLRLEDFKMDQVLENIL